MPLSKIWVTELNLGKIWVPNNGQCALPPGSASGGTGDQTDRPFEQIYATWWCMSSYVVFIFLTDRPSLSFSRSLPLCSLGSSLSRSNLVAYVQLVGRPTDLYLWYIYLLTCNINDRPYWSFKIYATVWCTTNHGPFSWLWPVVKLTKVSKKNKIPENTLYKTTKNKLHKLNNYKL